MEIKNIGYDVKKYEVTVRYHVEHNYVVKVYAPDELSAGEIARRMFGDGFKDNCHWVRGEVVQVSE